MNARFFLRHCFVVALFFAFASPTDAEEVSAQVRVMSFNIRYGTANDGLNHWDHRKEFVAETIRAFAPDLLGTQEMLGFQRDYLSDKLPEYENLGVGRVDGGTDGEMTALFYRTDRFEKLDGGHFWLSETPEKLGSISWDSSLPRMATWVKLSDRQAVGSPAIFFFNTHFDHKGVVARNESARLMREKVEEIAGDELVVITGDFNAGEGSVPYQALFGEQLAQMSPVVDSYRSARPTMDKSEGTFSGFKSQPNAGARIDWIGVSRQWNVLSANIDYTSKNGSTPSDHFPVTVVITRDASVSKNE